MAVVFTISTNTRTQVARSVEYKPERVTATLDQHPSLTKPGLVCDAGVFTHHYPSSAILNTPASDFLKDATTGQA